MKLCHGQLNPCCHVHFTDAVLWSATLEQTESQSPCNDESKKTNTCLVLSLNVSYYSQVYLLFSLSPVRLRDLQSDSAAQIRHHERTEASRKESFKQRRCNISPRVKHHFYFRRHKAVFRNNWEPTAVDSWKWSFGGVVWRREMLWRLPKQNCCRWPKKSSLRGESYWGREMNLGKKNTGPCKVNSCHRILSVCVCLGI